MTIHASDGQTERQTDRIVIARPCLHSMQRGKKLAVTFVVFFALFARSFTRVISEVEATGSCHKDGQYMESSTYLGNSFLQLSQQEAPPRRRATALPPTFPGILHYWHFLAACTPKPAFNTWPYFHNSINLADCFVIADIHVTDDRYEPMDLIVTKDIMTNFFTIRLNSNNTT